jgi:peptide/nickel transport system ATP-binding protein/oligopeptide transport system ATP-binding protein
MLSVQNLSVHFTLRSRSLFEPSSQLVAVDDVSFAIPHGQTVGLVGESGSGKSTIGRCIVKLQIPTQGRILWGEPPQDIVPMSQVAFLPLRKKIQMIFQDPFGSLNPRWTIAQVLSEPLEIHFPAMSKEQRTQRSAELLKKVGLHPDSMQRRPHEFSGGQRQRIGIARALAVEPDLIICDEPVSALDVSVQAQIVNLLQDLQEELGIAYLFIAHDLAVVQHISHHVIVLHHGKIVESAPAEQIYANPQHDYTRSLLAAVPTF